MKRLSLAGAALVMAVFAVACSKDTTGPVASGIAPPASPAAEASLTSNTQWRVSNGLPATNRFWDINQLDASTPGNIGQFPINRFLTTSTGSFAIYLVNNYNVDITDKTLAFSAAWTGGPFSTRSGGPESGAFVRFEFQDVASGQFNFNDYWWSTGSNSLDLNSAPSGSLSVSLSDRSSWSNICGKSANDQTIYTGPDCVGGTYPAVSPYDGFTNAMKNVKQVNLSFGSASRYASGVAGTNPGIFTFNTFTITP